MASSGTFGTTASVGGGAGGVELCFAVYHRLKTHMAEKKLDLSMLEVILLNRGPSIMSSHCKSVINIYYAIIIFYAVIIYYSIIKYDNCNNIK